MTAEFPEVTWLSEIGLWPSISPTGSMVVFVVNGAELHTVPMAAGPGQPIFVQKGKFATRPDWSWSEQIAFTLGESGTNTIWLIDGDGGNLTLFPHQGSLQHSIYPSWFRDLAAIAIDDVTDQSFNRIYRIERDEPGEPVLLTPASGFCAGRPTVNPAGTAVAFAGRVGPFEQENNQIWIVTPPSTEPVQLDPLQGRSPNWSPDGRWILFESNRNTGTDGNYQLFIAPAPGASAADAPLPPVAITPPGIYCEHGEWSRQQDRIVFDRPSGGIGRIDVPEQFRMIP